MKVLHIICSKLAYQVIVILKIFSGGLEPNPVEVCERNFFALMISLGLRHIYVIAFFDLSNFRFIVSVGFVIDVSLLSESSIQFAQEGLGKTGN